jgi:hypothetical protein
MNVVHHLIFLFYLLATAFVFARVEIEIEGPEGWAANLPTWRIHNKWTKLLYGSRPLTGYHLWMQVFVLLLVHAPFGMGLIPWAWPAELRVIGFYILFFLLEDFLWFVLNPAFGLKRFRREHIWWHAPTWWWIMPRDYWVFGALGIGMYIFGAMHVAR